MKLRVVHRTTYLYSEAVSTSYHEAHLAPRDGEGARLVAHDMAIDPTPGVSRERLDYFGNRALHFSIREPHRTLEVVATSTVDVTPKPAPLLHTTPVWQEVRDRLRRDRRKDILDAFPFTLDSTSARVGPPLAAYAAPSFTENRPILEAVSELTARVHADFAYDAKATDVTTPVLEVLRRRRGVCQDFAHFQISCLRSLGLAARYVSGYLLTRPPPGRPKLVGADASHAWLSVFVPDFGWVDFDPTNNLIPSDEHLTVAQGRDFADVTPLKGVIHGGGRHEVRVAVDVGVA